VPTIAEKILKARKESGLSQWELGIKCGEFGKQLSGITIYNYENGKTSPTVESLESIAKATGTKLILEFHK
jgi:transcriptional regulator with XRE-family HTH domain